MPGIYLVRHGKAAAGWDTDHDPGLDDLGRIQSRETANALAPLGPLNIISSPMLRTRETSIPLSKIWHLEPRIEPRVAEIPSPTEILSERAAWLHQVMSDKWCNLTPDLLQWRQGVIDAILEIAEDTVVFSHFIAINVIAGEAEGSDRVIVFKPDNGSVTVIETGSNVIKMVERGAEAGTRVN